MGKLDIIEVPEFEAFSAVLVSPHLNFHYRPRNSFIYPERTLIWALEAGGVVLACVHVCDVCRYVG